MLRVHARRFVCRWRACSRRIGAEQLSGADPRVRRTRRLRANLRAIVDDLEERRVVDLLDETTVGAFSGRLQTHPGVEVISRDRSRAFAKGGREGASDAIQIADRWHILKNLGDVVQASWQRIHRQLPLVEPTTEPSPAASASPPGAAEAASTGTAPRPRQHEQEGLLCRARRFDRYQAVLDLKCQGLMLRAVARTLDLSRKTARTYLAADAFPEMAPRRKRPSILDPHRADLAQRW